MTEEPGTSEVESEGEEEASWQEPEPATEPPADEQTHNPGGDRDPEAD
jgi:hypothetical protein